MRAKLVLSNIETELDFEELDYLSLMLKDDERHQAVFHELAKSEIDAVRISIADKTTISAETVKILGKDPSVEVLRELITNHNATRFLDKESLTHMLDTNDNEICLVIADSLQQFAELMDVEPLCEILVQKGPSVRLSLAKNTRTPIFILTELTDDRDVAVAKQAKETIDEIRLIEKPNKSNTRVCSFCKKSEDMVYTLIAGCCSAYICDECIEICREIVQEKKGNKE